MAKDLPTPQLTVLAPGLTLLRPLSHRGEGPGLIVLSWDSSSSVLALANGVPSLSMKWAEEGYTVVEIRSEAWQSTEDPLAKALNELSSCDVSQPKDQVGLVGRSILQSTEECVH